MSTSLGKLLLVDDNEMNRDMLSRRLTRRGYEVMVAADGNSALRLLASDSFDLVLLDIMMPGLSGWDVLQWIRTHHSRLDLPVIMVTAKDQSEDIVRALQNGANDYVTKPLDLEVALARIGTHVILKLTHQKLRAANQKLKKDLVAAAQVQRSYLPARTPSLPGCQIAWYYRPCDELGGDFLNVFDLDEQHVGIYLLDVSGHGVPSALMAVAVSRALTPGRGDTAIVARPDRTAAEPRCEITPPAHVADKLNNRFPMIADAGQYFTLIYGVLDSRSHVFRFTSAGHPPLVHLPRQEPPRLILFSGGPPIGHFQLADGVFGPYEEYALQLQPGDRLYLYSDGLVEERNGDGRAYGADQLLEKVANAAPLPLQDSVDYLADTLVQWRGSAEAFRDDVSMLAVEIL